MTSSIRTTLTKQLVVGIVAVSALAEVSYYFLSTIIAFETRITLGYMLIAANLLLAVAGLWTPRRMAWLAYLVISVALTILIGAVTPLSALAIAARLYSPF